MMQAYKYDSDQTAQVITFTHVREQQHEICLLPFTDNLDHLMALELESKWMLAVAFLRRGAAKHDNEERMETSCHPLSAFTIGVDLKQAEQHLAHTISNNRQREEQSLQNGVTLRFLEFCNTWQLDSFERNVVMLLLMQYAAPDFIAMYKESGFERYSDNGMEIRGLLALTSPDLRNQLANRRYFSVNAPLLRKRVVLAGVVDSTTNILGLSIYLHESNVCFILGDNHHYHMAFSFIRQERSEV